jgi:hypothetical protein
MKATVERVILFPRGVLQVMLCGRLRHVAWSRVTRVRYLPFSGLRIDARSRSHVIIGMGLLGFSTVVREVELKLRPQLHHKALSDLRRQYPRA